jgi:CAAX protease family protein
MNPFDDNSAPSPDALSGSGANSPEAQPAPPALGRSAPPEQVLGDPFAQFTANAGSAPYLNVEANLPYFRMPGLPEDLQISWSWPHLLLSIAFFFISQVAVGVVIFGYYSLDHHLSQSQIKKLIESPKFLVATTVIWSALMILFLYITLAVLRNLPFWSSLGWRKFSAKSSVGKGRPWMYFLAGCGLSIIVAAAGSRMKDVEHTPIQEIFKSPSGAMLLMSMAVFVAPLFEETLFRGYLYPVLTRIISSVAQFAGIESNAALRFGIGASIVLTGGLFGLTHAPQLGWTLGLVGMLVFVGVVFTFVRAWTGTVVASFFLHLGYNSMIAVTTIIATRGFTHMPTMK